MINNILRNEITAGKIYISRREQDLDDTRKNLVQEFEDITESTLRKQSEKMNEARRHEVLEREAMMINLKRKEDELQLASEANKRREREMEAMLREMKEESTAGARWCFPRKNPLGNTSCDFQRIFLGKTQKVFPKKNPRNT